MGANRGFMKVKINFKGRCGGCQRMRVLCEMDLKGCTGCDCGSQVGHLNELFGMTYRNRYDFERQIDEVNAQFRRERRERGRG